VEHDGVQTLQQVELEEGPVSEDYQIVHEEPVLATIAQSLEQDLLIARLLVTHKGVRVIA
jgi:hypothetical protein